MGSKSSQDPSELLTEVIINGIQEKKGNEIICLDLREIPNGIADFFIVCHGDSDRQVEAIADSVIEMTEMELDDSPWHKEGFENKDWILLDYVTVVVHIFHKNARDFYNLETLWADAKKKVIEYQK